MIAVRLYTPEDLPRLYELECACFSPPIRWDKKDFAPALAASDVWVAESSDQTCDQCRGTGKGWESEVCRLCNGGGMRRGPETRIIGFLSANVERRQGHIMTINVDPEHRGHGVASKLVIAAEDEYRKRKFAEMRLEVEQNNPAQTLYFKMGYRVTSVRKGWYEDGTTCLYMIKKL